MSQTSRLKRNHHQSNQHFSYLILQLCLIDFASRTVFCQLDEYHESPVLDGPPLEFNQTEPDSHELVSPKEVSPSHLLESSVETKSEAFSITGSSVCDSSGLEDHSALQPSSGIHLSPNEGEEGTSDSEDEEDDTLSYCLEKNPLFPHVLTCREQDVIPTSDMDELQVEFFEAQEKTNDEIQAESPVEPNNNGGQDQSLETFQEQIPESELDQAADPVALDSDVEQRPTRVRPPGLEAYKKVMAERAVIADVPPHAPSAGSGIPAPGTGEASDYNYAASVHGAKVVDVNKEAKGAKSILDEDRDKYLRNPCSVEHKYVIVELSDTLTRVTRITLANFEFYSSTLNSFRLSVARYFPTNDWMLVGEFRAVNVRTLQVFDVHPVGTYAWPLIRYVRLDMLTHHGSEFYCTLSLLRVHGVDELASLKEEIEAIRNSEASEGLAPQSSSPGPSPLLQPGPGQVMANLTVLRAAAAGTEKGNGSTSHGALAAVNGTDALQGDGNVSSMSAPGDGPLLRLENMAIMLNNESSLHQSGEGGESSSGGAPAVHMVSGRPSGGDFVLKFLTTKLKALEGNLSVLEQYMEDTLKSQQESLGDLDAELDTESKQIRKLNSSITEVIAEIARLKEELWNDSLSIRAEFAILALNHSQQLAVISQQLEQLWLLFQMLAFILAALSLAGMFLLIRLYGSWRHEFMGHPLLEESSNKE